MGEDMKYYIVLGKTLFFYVLITIVYRIMGKREIGELSIIDLIVSILIAELAAISIDKYHDSIFLSIIPIIALVIVQVLVAKISQRHAKVREVIEGKESVIINKGKINFEEMQKQRYNLDDLLTQLRNKGIRSIEEVAYAILETSGKLSIFQKQNNNIGNYPLPVIVDGMIQTDTLQQIAKNTNWLNKELVKEHLTSKDVFYAFYKEKELFIIKNESIK